MCLQLPRRERFSNLPGRGFFCPQPPARPLHNPRAIAMLESMKKWEYVTVPLLTHATKQILDNWGQDGWELVSVLPGPTGEQHVAYMKRELD